MSHLYLSRPASGKDYHCLNSVSSKQEDRPFKDGFLEEQRAWNLFLLIPKRMTWTGSVSWSQDRIPRSPFWPRVCGKRDDVADWWTVASKLQFIRSSCLTTSGIIVTGAQSAVAVQSLRRVWLFVTPWTVAHQASLSFTVSLSLLRLMSIESVMPSNHLILCDPLLLLPSVFPASGSFPMSQLFASSGQSIEASASILPMNILGWFPLALTGLISLLS